RRLDGADDRQPLDHPARRLELAVPAAEVAAVVIDDLAELLAVSLELAAREEVVDELRVVDDLPAAAELRVVVPERVQAVRAGRDDLLHAGPVQRLDVGLGLHLEQHFVAAAPRRVAGAALAVAEDRIVDAGRLQDLDHRLRLLADALVERAGAA